ncbi:DUF2789 domain-containing protein [Endozoicomonas ascidiicola]|uniref:DUF2789 domain-containing protein n=1 Tax=Endozoicomonas ascidiicola TaxID=1698521 RepID=UPI000A9B6C61|nr:DUF2789 domain-containing protein [Endozoicomonas ascidiicola]
MMHKPLHNLTNLFQQLGLGKEPREIERFLQQHSLESNTKLEDAQFWNPSQKAFIKEERNQDADWCEAIDELDALLRH